MDYKDFNLLEDYQNMAKEYYAKMQKSGYVFVRVTDVDEQKMQAERVLFGCMQDVLAGYDKIQKFLKRPQQEFLLQLQSLTKTQFDTLKRMYGDCKPQDKNTKNATKKTFVGEMCLLKAFLQLLFLEDLENLAVLKNMIFERLDLLSKQ